MVNIGTDIDSSWTFSNGDIRLVSDESNLGQAIINRLRADTDTYNIFYAVYGGNLFEYMGELNHQQVHEYIKIEIESILQQDPRIANVDCSVMRITSNNIECNLKVNPTDTDEVISYNFVLTDENVINILRNEVDE